VCVLAFVCVCVCFCVCMCVCVCACVCVCVVIVRARADACVRVCKLEGQGLCELQGQCCNANVMSKSLGLLRVPVVSAFHLFQPII
jgi:hypothetical protein